ncbi:hypothetical protein AB7813_12765 [Tardiphaga sp. 20_F10_N6_6]|uniref:hypothetical protein n=1 Tax=Tardiphaga sp. 20_F10_N6_6 TaxID=3240788 RepID=UPI003F8BDA24
MSDDDEPVTEIAAPPVPVPETNRQWKLTPALNLLEKSRQIAIVSAETEDDARAIATTADPMGRNWRDAHLFTADSMETTERHVIGDVIFRSTPAPPAPKPKPKRSKKA